MILDPYDTEFGRIARATDALRNPLRPHRPDRPPRPHQRLSSWLGPGRRSLRRLTTSGSHHPQRAQGTAATALNARHTSQHGLRSSYSAHVPVHRHSALKVVGPGFACGRQARFASPGNNFAGQNRAKRSLPSIHQIPAAHTSKAKSSGLGRQMTAHRLGTAKCGVNVTVTERQTDPRTILAAQTNVETGTPPSSRRPIHEVRKRWQPTAKDLTDRPLSRLEGNGCQTDRRCKCRNKWSRQHGFCDGA